jgi:broad specificity phosphatase PhoE
MDHILQQCAGRHVLVVTHSGPLRVILSEALGSGLSGTRRFASPFAAWSRILHHGGRPYVEFINRQPSLAEQV